MLSHTKAMVFNMKRALAALLAAITVICVGCSAKQEVGQVVFDIMPEATPAPTQQIAASTAEQGTVASTPVQDTVTELKKGMSGPEIQELQERLIELGYLVIDESTQKFGPATKEAVKLFQRQVGLDVDGVVGAVTSAAVYDINAQICSGEPVNGNESEPDPTPTPKPTKKPAGTGALSTSTPKPQATTPSSPESVFADFTAMNINGGTVSERIILGNRLTFLNMWWYNCGPCINEMPDLQKLSEKYSSKGVVFLGLVCGKTTILPDEMEINKARDAIASTGVRYTNFIANEELYEGYFRKNSIEGYPTTLIIDRNGKVLDVKLGSKTAESWEYVINDWLSKTEG